MPQPPLCSARPAVVLLILASSLFLLAGCSGPRAVQPPVTETPTGPSYEVTYFDETGLNIVDVRTASVTSLAPDGAFLDLHVPSPDGSRLAVAYATADSSKLTLVDLETATVRPVHATAGRVVYTAVWAPDGDELAFGYYRARRDGAPGPGDLLIATADGRDTRQVGCSVSKRVESWRRDGNLIVGDGANLYVVDDENCETLHTIPLLKKHFITVSPDGEWVAYIFRDLVYNRDNRSYEPDSSLYVVDFKGENEQQIAGDRYRAHNLTWSPDGTRLAFDVQAQDADGPSADDPLRHVAYYDVDTGESTFLVRPDPAGIPSETKPVWSPDGAHIAFDRVFVDSGRAQKAVRTFADMSLRVVTETASAAALPETWGWAGNDALVLITPDGQKELVPLTGFSVYTLTPGQTPVYARYR